VRGGSVSMWAVSQNVFCVPVHILDSQSFPGERPSRRRAMRRRKRASLDVLRVPSTRERRYSRSEHRRKRVMRAFAATPSERRAIAERETPYFSWSFGGKATGGFPARDGAALTRRRGKSAHNPRATVFGPTMPTFPRARNAPNVERRALAPP